MIYDDRREAGRQLARQLRALRGSDPLILALPRGGVEVGYELALALKGELDLWIVRKLGVPGHEEFGMGALSEGGGVYLNRQTIARLGISDEAIATVAEREAAEIERRVRRYRGDRPQPKVTGRTVVLVDDGIATGGTVRAALQALRELEPRMLILAVPVAPPETLETLRPLVDELVCGYAPADFMAVGEFYRAFPQTSDEEVIRLLEQARRTRAPNQAPAVMKRPQQGPLEREVRIPIARTELEGTLQVPGGARGIVLFAHGSGSSRFSPRNRFVADVLRRAGLGTLLIDLLTPQEEGQDALTGELRFDIPFLASRLVEVSEWMTAQDEL
ncbi:MAG: phosphoribosyltransferase family protein, partial [Myxococcales bacterium]